MIRAALVALLCFCAPVLGQPKIAGATKYRPHELVKLKAEGIPEKAALVWRVSPSKGVWRATNPRGVFEFSSVPGTFEVTLLVVAVGADGAISLDEVSTTVEVEGCEQNKPAPSAPKADGGKLDPARAVSRITFGNAGCTATAVGPRRTDGRWDVLTAAHCVNGVGERGTMVLQDGRRVGVRVAVHDKTADVCWLTTDESVAEMPYSNLSEKNPAVGAKVWHAGYGVDRPGNREDGHVQADEDDRGQLRFVLNVSSGDSGGPIFDAATNEVTAAVCCTLERGAKVSMWGGSCVTAAKLRPKLTDGPSWSPALMPERGPVKGEWQPVDIPVRPLPTGLVPVSR